MTRYRLLLFFFVGIAVSVLPASAMIREEADVRLDVTYKEAGVKAAALMFGEVPDDIEAIKAGMAAWFGVDESEVVVEEDVEEYPIVILVGRRLGRIAPLVYNDTLGQAALRGALEAAGVEQVQLVAFLPPSPIAVFGALDGVSMLGVLRHEEIVPVAALDGTWEVRFGWRYRDLAIYIGSPILFLLFFDLGLWYVRRRALAVEGPDSPAAIFACGRVHHLGSLVFLAVWPGLLTMLVPMGYFLYVPRDYLWAALVFRVLLPILIAFLFVVRIRVALFPVFQAFPEPNWSRRELFVQGCVVGLLCVFLLPVFGMSVPMLWLRGDTSVGAFSTLSWLPIAALVTSIVLYSRLVPSVIRTPETSAEQKRLEALAGWMDVNDKPLLRVYYYPRGILCRAMDALVSLNAIRARVLRGVEVTARFLRDATPEEIDAILLTRLDRWKQTHWRLVPMVRAAYLCLILPGLLIILLFVLVSANESSGVKIFFNGWFVFTTVYLVPALIVVAGRAIETGMARRSTRRTDEMVLKELDAPEVFIRAVLREARLNCEPLSTPKWLRFLLALSPTERVEHVAAYCGIPNDEVSAIRDQIDATTRIGVADRDGQINADLDRLSIRLNLIRMIPVFAFVALPLIAEWGYHEIVAEFVPLWVFLAITIPLGAILPLALQNYLWKLGARRLVASLRESFPRPGSWEHEWQWVEFAPVQRLTDLHRVSTPSIGVLFGEASSLCFRSDDRFLEMRATEIERIGLVTCPSGLFPMLALRIEWRNPDTNVLRTFHALPIVHDTIHRANTDAIAFHRRIVAWWRAVNAGHAEAWPDEAGSVRHTVKHPAFSFETKYVTSMLAVVGVFGALVALYAGWSHGLPLRWDASDSAFILPVIFLGSTGAVVLLRMYYLRWLLKGEG